MLNDVKIKALDRPNFMIVEDFQPADRAGDGLGSSGKA